MCVVTHGEGFAYAARQDRQKKKGFFCRRRQRFQILKAHYDWDKWEEEAYAVIQA